MEEKDLKERLTTAPEEPPAEKSPAETIQSEGTSEKIRSEEPGADVVNDTAPEQPQANQVLKKPGNAKRIGRRVLLLFVVLAAACGGFFYANNFGLHIALAGEQELLVEYGEHYQEPGAQAVLTGKWLFMNGFVPEDVQLQISSDLQEDTLGKYTVTYTAEYLCWSATAQRSLRVVDTQCPVITLVDTDKTVLPGQPYEEEGYSAIDNYDGDITDQVHISQDGDILTYVVMDSSGNPTAVEREIPYFDPLPPEILLEGGDYLTLSCGTIYSEPGYCASDNVDGDLTAEVAVEGEVLWYKPGTYEVSYTVSDVFGNVTQKVRTVEVQGIPRPDVKWPNGRVIYLTFDDGPGPSTIRLLNLLKQYGVKATFFVTGSGDNGELWRMYKEGHSIGMHTRTHDYNSIYTSPEAFFTDLYAIQDVIYRNTGIRPTLMRFPGGGSNLVSSYNEGIMSILTEAVQDSGFQYFDWNVDSNDAGGALRAETVANNVIAGVQNHRVSIVLQHDIHDFSVEAVEDIIIWGLNNGYTFLPLTENSPTMHHTVLN